jgi:SAM-dependent methyltransferase
VLRPTDVPALRCPETGGPLRWVGRLDDGRLWEGTLTSDGGPSWPVQRGWARLFREDRVGPSDRFMRRWFYDAVPFLHDAAVRVAVPVLQAGGTEAQARWFIADRLRLGALRPHDDGTPVRVLEVSVGRGANLPYLRTLAPADLPVEWWGLDLASGMLRGARRTVRRLDLDMRLIQADAHRLPLADALFDRVLHVGGINAFSDVAGALSEMCRVARDDARIVVVDEQLDPRMRPSLYQRAGFRLATFYDDDPRSPTDRLPAGVRDVRDEQASPFFYCLSFGPPSRSG